MKSLSIDGATIQYHVEGQGEPLLLLHGYPQNHRCWRHQVEAFRKDYQVITPDWFGWGDSERNFGIKPRYDLEVDRLKQFINALNLDQFNFAAHDYGGYLALGYAVENTKKIKRLAILNSRAHQCFTPFFYLQTYIQCCMARNFITRPMMNRFSMYSIHKRAMKKYVQNGSFNTDQLEEYLIWLKSSEGKHWITNFYRYYDVKTHPTVDGNLSKIICPTAIIWGKQDPYCNVEIGKSLSEKIRNSTLNIIEEADHYVMEEAPAQVNKALRLWLEPSISNSTLLPLTL